MSVAAARGKAWLRIRTRATGYLFILPVVVFFVVFVAYPFLQSLYLSLTQWPGYGDPQFIGLRNFTNLARDHVFWTALRDTLAYTVVTTVLQTVLPLLVAVLVNAGWRGSVFFRTALFLPAVISLVVSGMLWRLIYDPNFGTLDGFLNSVGLHGLAQTWLSDPRTALPAIVVVALWQSLGFNMVIFYAGLQGIDGSLYEAASIDGATKLQQLVNVTVPMLWPITLVVVTLSLINGFKVFDLVYVMTGGGPNHASEVLGTYLYNTAFGGLAGGTAAMGYASAIGLVIFALAMTGVILRFRLTRGSGDAY